LEYIDYFKNKSQIPTPENKNTSIETMDLEARYNALREADIKIFNHKSERITNEIDFFFDKIVNKTFKDAATKPGLYNTIKKRVAELEELDPARFSEFIKDPLIKNRLDSFIDIESTIIPSYNEVLIESNQVEKAFSEHNSVAHKSPTPGPSYFQSPPAPPAPPAMPEAPPAPPITSHGPPSEIKPASLLDSIKLKRKLKSSDTGLSSTIYTEQIDETLKDPNVVVKSSIVLPPEPAPEPASLVSKLSKQLDKITSKFTGDDDDDNNNNNDDPT
jgi:hypothetical protein